MNVPIILTQYECIECKKKWYINSEDKISDNMICPYGCKCEGCVVRVFNLSIKDIKKIKALKEVWGDNVNKCLKCECALNEDGLEGEGAYCESCIKEIWDKSD